MDPYQWQQERRQIKSSLSASPDKCTSSPDCSSALASVSSHPSQLTSLPVDLPVLGDLELSEEIAETHVRPSADTGMIRVHMSDKKNKICYVVNLLSYNILWLSGRPALSHLHGSVWYH